MKYFPCLVLLFALIFSLNAQGQNPIFTTNPIVTVNQGQEYFYPIKAVDPEGGAISYSASLPSWLSLGASENAVVTTFAGSFISGFQEGVGANATFNNPAGAVVDVDGNIYVADRFNHRIRKIATDGVVTTFAGAGRAGFQDGLGEQAFLNSPSDLLIDDNGDILFVDGGNYVIRKISSNGSVTTIVGSGIKGFKDGTGTEVEFGFLSSIDIDSQGNLYALDGENKAVRKITPEGVVTTFVDDSDTGSPGNPNFSSLSGLAIDGDDNVFIGDYIGRIVRRITPEGVISVIAGSGRRESVDGQGLDASFTLINQLEVDEQGNVLVADDNLVRVISPEGNVTTIRIGQTPVGNENLGTFNVYGIALDSEGNIITTSTFRGKILKTFINGTTTLIAGGAQVPSIDDLRLTSTFNALQSISSDQEGNVFITESNSSTIRKISVDGRVTTIAGSSQSGYQDGTATQTKFSTSLRITASIDGNIYIADQGNYVIRKIDQNGVVTTLAGSGSYGHADGQGTLSSFKGLGDIATDNEGNIYVTDVFRVRKITPQGLVSTLAGSDTFGFANGMGSQAQFRQISGIDVDAEGNVYVVDNGNYRVRKISADGNVSTYAGSGTQKSEDGTGTGASFYFPYSIAIGDNGEIYVSDTYQLRVIESDLSVSTIAGNSTNGANDGIGLDASFSLSLIDIDVDLYGNLLVADYDNYLIRKVLFSSPLLKGNAGNNVGIHNVSITATDDNGNETVQSFQIEVVDTEDPVFTSATTANFAENVTGIAYTITATDASPLTYSLGTENDESLFNVDVNTGEVTFKVSPDFETPGDANADNAYVIEVKASDGVNISSQTVTISVTKVNQLPVFTSVPVEVADDNTSYTYTIRVADSHGDIISFSAPTLPNWLNLQVVEPNTVTTYAGTGQLGTADGSVETASFSYPTALVFDDMGNMYVADQGWDLIRKISNTGQVTIIAGGGNGRFNNGQGQEASFDGPTGLVLDKSGNLYVADAFNHLIRKITPEGLVSTFAGSTSGFADGIGADAKFDQPGGLVIDSSDNIYVADVANNRIRKISPNGEVTTLAGNGNTAFADGNGASSSFYFPINITIDSDDNLYVSDTYNNRIRKITPSGDVTTLAGSTAGYLDGPLSTAKFNKPRGIALDSEGNIYVAEEGNYDIRKISKEGIVSTLAGNQAPGNNDGVGLNAGLREPSSMILGKDGLLYFTDPLAQRVRTINPDPVVQLKGSVIGQKGVHQVEIVADDNVGGTVSQSFSILINDITKPIFTSTYPHAFYENSTDIVYKVTAFDTNPVTFSLGSNNDESLFDLNSNTGELTFKLPPDFEKPLDSNQDNIYEIVINLSDGSNFESRIFSIRVWDQNDITPVFTSPTSSTFAENGTGIAYTITATDANNVTYSLGVGIDEALFNVNAATGEVTFKVSPDFEAPTDANTDNSYVIEVKASDGLNTASQNVTITITDVDDTPPVFTSATAISFAENGTGTAYTITATDANAITYSLGTGNDEALFNIAAGVVTFKTATDFETKSSYIIQVRANDGLNTAAQTVVITITDVDEILPVFTSLTIANFAENGTGIAYTITATDASSLTYSLGTENEEALFNVDATTGEVTFKVSPDFENPADANTDNDYVIKVIASDGQNIAEQTVTITISDVIDENPVFTSTPITEVDDKSFYSYTARANSKTYFPLNLKALDFPDWLSIKSSYKVSTLAGRLPISFKNGNKQTATFNHPSGMVFDSNGNLFIADRENNVIRKIDIDGSVITFAGSGYADFKDGNSKEAAFHSPHYLAIDNEDNLYVSDLFNHAIRKVTKAGEVTTIAGNGQLGYKDGIGFDSQLAFPYGIAIDSEGNIFISDSKNNRIRKINTEGYLSTFVGSGSYETINANGVNAAFTSPTALAIDANDNLYVAEGEYVIRKVNRNADVTTIVGNGLGGYKDGIGTEAQLYLVTDMTFDNSGNLLFNDGFNSTVRQMTPEGVVTTIAGTGEHGESFGPAISSSLMIPLGIVVDQSDNIFIAELFKIKVINSEGLLEAYATGGTTYPIDIYDGDGVGSEASFEFIWKVSNDSKGNLIVTGDGGIRKITPQGVVSTITNFNIGNSWGIYVDNSDEVFFTDLLTNQIKKMTPNGQVSIVAGVGTEGLLDGDPSIAEFKSPRGIVKDNEGALYIADSENHRIRKVSLSGEVTTFGGATQGYQDGSLGNAQFDYPSDIEVSEEGDLFVVDRGNKLIRKISKEGQVSTFAGNKNLDAHAKENVSLTFQSLNDIVFDDLGNLWVADDKLLKRVNAEGVIDLVIGNLNKEGNADGDSESATFQQIEGISFHNGILYLLDVGNHTVRQLYVDELTLSGITEGNVGVYNVALEAADIFGNSKKQEFVLSVKDATGPVIEAINPITYIENSSIIVADINATDTNPNAVLRYKLGINNDEAIFSIVELTGVIRFNSPPDFENPLDKGARNIYQIEVEVSDGVNVTNQLITITVIDTDDTPPVFTSATAVTFAENGTGTAYTITATDANTITYSLGTGNDEALFNIAAGIVTFKTAPDFEAKSSYIIQVKANDGLNTASQNVTITITDVDEIKPTVVLSTDASSTVFTPSIKVSVKFSETVNGLAEADFDAVNATISELKGQGDTYSFLLTSVSDGEISVKLKVNAVVDGASNNNEVSAVLSRIVEARNESPTEILLDMASINENIAIRAFIGLLSAKDMDLNDSHQFILVGGAGSTNNASFEIIGNKLFKKADVSFDFETAKTQSIRIKTIDVRGGDFEAELSIAILNVAEPSFAISIVNPSTYETSNNALTHGRVKVGASTIRQIKVKNTSSDAVLTVSDLKLPTGFTSSETAFNLEIGVEKTLDITFKPESAGLKTGALQVISNAGNKSLSLAALGLINKAPIAVAPEVRVNHKVGERIELRGYDPEGDPIEFVVIDGPSLGTLTATADAGFYSFVPNALAPEERHQDRIKFKVVEKGGGLSSNEATLKFGFNVADQPHTLKNLSVSEPTADQMTFTLNFEDKVVNSNYKLKVQYFDIANRTNFVLLDAIKPKSGMTINGDQAALTFEAVKADHPLLFGTSKVPMLITLSSANGNSATEVYFLEGQPGNRVIPEANDSGSDDGNHLVFAGLTSVPENETREVKLFAIELGDFSLENSTIEITKGPLYGTINSPAQVDLKSNLVSWSVNYTSTQEVGSLDSLEFTVTNPERNTVLSAYARIAVIEVADAPVLTLLSNVEMNEDETLSLDVKATDPDSELEFSAVSSDGTNVPVSLTNGKLQITPIKDFNGVVNISVSVTEKGVTSPLSDFDDFQLTIAPVNDAPVVSTIQDVTINEDGETTIELSATDVDASIPEFDFQGTVNSPADVSFTIVGNQMTIKPSADYFGELAFTIKSDDRTGTSSSLSQAQSFKLNVLPINDAPIVTKALSTQTLIEGFPTYGLDLSNFFTDKEKASKDLIYSVTNLSNVTLSITGSVLNISSVAGNTGLQTAMVTVSDGELSVSQSINFITASSSVDITVANALSDLTLDEDFGTATIDLAGVFAYPINSNATFNYSLAGNQSISATINNGKIELQSLANFNGADQLFVTALVDGKAKLISFKINVSPVNDAPALVSLISDISVDEDTMLSSTILANTFADVDNDVLTYAASYNADWLTFDANTRTFSGTPINDQVGEVEVTVSATDPSGAKATDVFKIVVNNTNDAPTSISINTNSLNENVAVGTLVGSLSSADVDAGDTNFSYALVGGTGSDDNGQFAIVGSQLLTLGDFDFESKASYSIRVRTIDGFEGSFTQAMTISVNNVNESPTDISIDNLQIAENSPISSQVGVFASTDPDTGDTHSYAFVEGEGADNNAFFEISGNKLLTKSELDYETKQNYSIRIKTLDGAGLGFEEVFIVTVVNDAEAILRLEGGESPEITNVGETSDISLVIHNDGDGELNITAISYPSGFSGQGSITGIAAGTSQTINVTFTPTEAKTYSGDIVFTYNGGISIKSVSAEAQLVTSIEEGFIVEEEVTIFPNPAMDEVTLDLTEYNYRAVDVMIITESGVSMYERTKIKTTKHTVNVSNYSQGVFIVLIKSEFGVIRKKLMISR